MTIEQVKAKLRKITGARLTRAEQAIAAGVAFVTVKATGRKVAVVGSKSGNGSYVVSGTGCTCKGYTNHGYCCHSDAVYLMLAARAERKGAAPAASAEGRLFPCATCEAPVTDNGDPFCPDCRAALAVSGPVADPAAEFRAWLDELERSDAEAEIAARTTAAIAAAHTGPVGRRVEEY